MVGQPVLAWSLASAREACAGVVAVLPESVRPQSVRPESVRPESVRPQSGEPESGGDGSLVPRTDRSGCRGAGTDGGGFEVAWEADVIVAGGPSRSASVRAGLAAVPADVEIIAVHDAARPLVPLSVWTAVLDAVAGGADAAIPVLAVTDTVKEVATDGTLRTLDRSRLVAVQTPQAFRASILRRAHSAGTDATDDAALVEAFGGRVQRVPGSRRSAKITDPEDLVVAAALIGGTRSAGSGSDHREGST
ncbi:MAG: 2-C-methyl-D-erythritol 4-phosphate cytidylyltransferase [Actinomycetota bacterium]|nr:2-C-methyl-D-erythritol 4-phosphate cytidylyltransferase [Actinomycetota bacterium]